MPSLSGGESYALACWREEPRLEAPYFPGKPANERRKQSTRRLDIIIEDLQRAFEGRSQL